MRPRHRQTFCSRQSIRWGSYAAQAANIRLNEVVNRLWNPNFIVIPALSRDPAVWLAEEEAGPRLKAGVTVK